MLVYQRNFTDIIAFPPYPSCFVTFSHRFRSGRTGQQTGASWMR